MEDVERVTINSGDIYVAERPAVATTVLGSCVAVCLWERELRVGGMNHYLLPAPNSISKEYPVLKDSYKYGTISIEALIQKLYFAGAKKERLVAKVFGGGMSLFGKGPGASVGAKNVEVAESILREVGILVVGRDVGGREGRKVVFDTHNGRVLVRRLHEVCVECGVTEKPCPHTGLKNRDKDRICL